MITRRGFIQGLASGAAMLGLGAPAPAPGRDLRAIAPEKTPPGGGGGGAAERVALGRTGIRVSRLGVGTGTSGWGGRSDQTRLGHDRFVALLRHAMERGVNYIDAADQYGSHAAVRDALAGPGVDADDVFVLTKTNASTAEAVRGDVDRFRKELGVEVLGCVLLHCMKHGDWPERMRPAMDALSEAKAAGKVRSIGVSCHGWKPLAACRGVAWIDVQLARINPFGSQMDGQPGDVAAELAAMHRAGRGVLGMKIFGGGERTGAEQRDASLRYVLGLPSVDAFTIGFSSIEQFDETFDAIGRIAAERA